MNPFRHFGRTPSTGDRPIERPLPTHDSTTQKNSCRSLLDCDAVLCWGRILMIRTMEAIRSLRRCYPTTRTIHTCLERDSKPRSQCSGGSKPNTP